MKGLIFLLFIGLMETALAQKTNYASTATDLNSLKYSVAKAPEWTALLKRKSGWFGGDGIFTIPFTGSEHRAASNSEKVLFIFSDTMIGEVKGDVLLPGAKMIHNSIAVLTGNRPEKDKIRFYWTKSRTDTAESIFIPHTPNTRRSDYFWLGDGFVNKALNNNIYVFGYRIKDTSDVPFGFKEVGNVLLKIPAGSKPPFSNYEQKDTPFYLDDGKGNSGSFGAGIYVNTKDAGAPDPDGYVYIYGVVSKWKNLLVARVLPKDFEEYSKWNYWNGNAWVSNIHKARKVADWVSNELSVSPLPDGRYALVFQIGTMTKDIGLRIGKTPYGPFGPAIKIWDCSQDLIKETYTVYNAKAHPSLSNPGELVISYNINSTQFLKDLQTDPNLYRPRFIKLKFK